MPVELRWDGKYTDGDKKSSPIRVELPFQMVETVNASAQERRRAGETVVRRCDRTNGRAVGVCEGAAEGV